MPEASPSLWPRPFLMTCYLTADSEDPRTWEDWPDAPGMQRILVGGYEYAYANRFLSAVRGEGFGRTPEGMMQYLSGMSSNRSFCPAPLNSGPWGQDAMGHALVPWRSIAVDRERISLGTRLKVRELSGRVLPNGRTHDGLVLACDTGGRINEDHFDLFVGTHTNKLWLASHCPENVMVELA